MSTPDLDPAPRHRPHHRFRQPGDAADRAARARGRRLLRNRAVPVGRGGFRAAASRRRSSSPAVRPPCPTKAARARRRSCSTPACRSSASATASRPCAVQLGGKVEGGHHREFGRADVEILKPAALFDGVWAVGDSYPVWMSHGDRVTRPAGGFEVIGTSPNAPFAIAADESRKYYATMFHPEVVHTPDGAQAARQFRAQDRRPRGRLDDGRLPRAGDRRDPRAGRRGQACICGLSGGVDSSVAARADPRGDRRPADLHLRRPRPDAQERGGARSSPCSASTTTSRSSMWMPPTCSSARSKARPIPEAKRKTIGRLFIEVFEDEAKKIGGARVPRPGHALSRRDRKRLLHRRPVGDDQDPPQCRRPARAHEHEAGRAAARTVQGRGARARPRTRPAGRISSAAIRSPGRASPSAVPAASRARSSTSCARPTRSISTKSARPASTTRSGRPSPCCCRCRPSA